MKIKPINDKLVITDPETLKRVPPEGVDVDVRKPFWRRRLAEGSMVEDKPTPTNKV